MSETERDRLFEQARAAGPIQDFVETVADEERTPSFAVALCTLRIDESGPLFRAALARAADDGQVPDPADPLVLRGLYILGGARDAQGFSDLLRFLRLSSTELEEYLGDVVTEDLSKIVAGMFDGNVDALFGAIADRSIDEYVRGALLGAATWLAFEGRIEVDRMAAFLQRFSDERLADDQDMTWIEWEQAIGLLGLRRLAPLVAEAWRDGRFLPGMIDESDLEEFLVAAERAPSDATRLIRQHLGYIEDVVEALERFDNPYNVSSEDDRVDKSPMGWTPPMEPAINPLRHVGRNDPCPCGSGRKAKKCCLAT